jgi:LmbE family N-acetylglucosaminyl deacetylase
MTIGAYGLVLYAFGAFVGLCRRVEPGGADGVSTADDRDVACTVGVVSLETFSEDWHRALAVVAHPDDLEYGAASAIARWTDAGKDIRYVMVTRGEAGIADMAPAEVGPARSAEEIASAAVVGVSVVEFLDHADGLVVADLHLRRDLARVIRRHRPEMVLSINHHDSWGGPSWNHADHRAVGVALLDAVRDAANPWVFTDLVGEGHDPWGGVAFVAFSGSPHPTHAVDVTGWVDRGRDSLRQHRLYLEHLDGSSDADHDPTAFLLVNAETAGPEIGVAHAATFEVIWF